MKVVSSSRHMFAFAFFALQLTHTSAKSWWNSTLHDLENDFDKAKEWFEKQVASEVADGLESVNGVLAQFSMGHSTVPPISASLQKSKLQSEITVGLYDASGDYPQPKAFDFAERRYDRWNKPWFGIALDSFDAQFEVDINLSESVSGENLTLPLLTIPAQRDGVVVEVEFQLYLTADASASMSFTAGLDLNLANPAAIMMPALDPIIDISRSQRIGFNPDDFVFTPIFNATLPKLDFNVQLSLRTVLSMTVEGMDVGAIYLDLPAFDLNVKTMTNRLRNCQTPPAGTPPDQIYAELIQLHGELDAILSYELLDGDKSGVLEKWTMWDALDECYAFLPGLGTIAGVPDSSKSPVLTAQALTTCITEGKVSTYTALASLSSNDRAAIAIGTILGVSIIAVIAWYGGRASQRRRTQEHEVEKSGRTLFSWPKKSESNSSNNGGYSPPLAQTTTSKSFFPSASGRWTRQKRKGQRYVNIVGPRLSSSENVTLEHGLNSSIAEHRENQHVGNGSGSLSVDSRESRIRSAESQELLQEGNRLLEQQPQQAFEH